MEGSEGQGLRSPGISVPWLDYVLICRQAALVPALTSTSLLTSRTAAGPFLAAAFALSFFCLLSSESLWVSNNPGEPKATKQRYGASQKELQKEVGAWIPAGACASVSQALTSAWGCLAWQKRSSEPRQRRIYTKSGEMERFTAILSPPMARRSFYLQCPLQAHLHSTACCSNGKQPARTPTPYDCSVTLTAGRSTAQLDIPPFSVAISAGALGA